MGPRLKTLVETQLLADLGNYIMTIDNLRFDWSDSCIEGHDTIYLDGQLENFSGIAVFNLDSQLIAEGWMDFVHEGNFFLAYWDFVTIWQDNKKTFEKANSGIPDHIWQQIPDHIKWSYEKARY